MPCLGSLLYMAAAVALAGCTSQPDTTAPFPTSAAGAPVALARALAATTRYAGDYRWREPEKDDMGGTLTVYPE